MCLQNLYNIADNLLRAVHDTLIRFKVNEIFFCKILCFSISNFIIIT